MTPCPSATPHFDHVGVLRPNGTLACRSCPATWDEWAADGVTFAFLDCGYPGCERRDQRVGIKAPEMTPAERERRRASWDAYKAAP